MDNLFAIGVGLALRAVIDSVAHHNHRVNGSLVGLWEGAVLHHFLAKFPTSFNPYIAFGFRLFVDLLFTESLTRMTIVVLWTGLGMLLSDLGVDMWADKRVRRLWRRIRLASPFYTSSSSSVRSPSRVQFMQIPLMSTASRSPQQSQVSSASQPSSIFLRPSARPVPGAFSELSEAESDASRQRLLSQQQQVRRQQQQQHRPQRQIRSPLSQSQTLPQPARSVDSASSADSVRTPELARSPESVEISLQPDPIPIPIPQRQPKQPSLEQEPPPAPVEQPQRRSHTPSELEYIPVIPDTPGDEYPPAQSRGPSSVASGLTTPREHGSPQIVIPSPRSDDSGRLTTPAHSPPPGRQEQLPPVTVYEDTKSHAQQHTPRIHPAELSDVPPVLIRLRPVPDDPEPAGEGSIITFPEPELADPNPSPLIVPPLAEIPVIPSSEDVEAVETTETVPVADDANRDPPPSYTQAQAEQDVPEHSRDLTVAESIISDHTVAESIISEHTKSAIVAKADVLRGQAVGEEASRAKLRREYTEARKNREYWRALQLKVEINEAEEHAKELHAKAARRYFKAHNLNPGPKEIDVHRLKVSEAVSKVERAIYDAMMSGTTELRVITGKGNHSVGGIPRLKLAIVGAMEDHHIPTRTDVLNDGVLIITIPAKPEAGPSQ